MRTKLLTLALLLLATLAAQADVAINESNFPDANFRSFLLSLYPHGYIASYQLNSCTTLNCIDKNISDLTGIKYFVALQELRCYRNRIRSLDVSGMTNLTYLDCDGNGMTSLNVTGLSNLTYLDCGPNELMSITGLSTCTSLQTLYCNDNSFNFDVSLTDCPSLTTVNVSNCPSLIYLYVFNDNLTSLNVTGNTGLRVLVCRENPNLSTITGLADCTAVRTLDCNSCAFTDLTNAISGMSNLQDLNCSYNNLVNLTVQNKSQLTRLMCHSNPQLVTLTAINNPLLTTLYGGGCPSMTQLFCNNNDLREFNIYGNTAMYRLECQYNANLTAISYLSSCKALQYLYCYNCNLNDLSDVNSLPNLMVLSCYNNRLSSLTVTNKSNLQFLYCYNNSPLTTLNITDNPVLQTINCKNCTLLTTVNCPRNALTSLNVTGNTALVSLDCNTNRLASITGLTDCSQLQQLRCYSNSISSLNVNYLTKLEALDCSENQMTSLNVTGDIALADIDCNTNSLAGITGLTDCSQLQQLRCNSNYITSLNVNNSTRLQALDCSENRLTSLNVSGKTRLELLSCYFNELTSLNVQNCSKLSALLCSSNRLTSLNLTGCSAMTDLLCYDNPNLSTMTGLAACTYLKTLNCSDCSLTALPGLTSLSRLESLHCERNRLTDLSTTSGWPFLEELYCQNNRLDSLLLGNCGSLKRFYCSDNTQMKKIHLFGHPSLQAIYCINCSSCKDAMFQICSSLSTLDVTGCTALEGLSVGSSEYLATITGLAGCTAMKHLNCDRNALTSLDAVNSMPDLEYLVCSYNKLTSLKLTNKSKLRYVYCHNNPQLKTITVTGNPQMNQLACDACPSLTTLYCYNNALYGPLDLSGCSALKTVYCYNNGLTRLLLSDCSALTTLYCHRNSIRDDYMTITVNGLPARPATSPGTMRVIYNMDEGNFMNDAQVATARAKNWQVKQYNGSEWVDYVMHNFTRGDVDGDGHVSIADVTALVDLIRAGGTTVDTNPAADADADGNITIADATKLIDYLLSGTWDNEPDIPSDGHEWVDLGLPSGTLWATCNVGASNPEDFGGYFAWGETAPKDSYSWSNYRWCNGASTSLTKYCTNSFFGTVDNKTELDTEDDAAFVNWGPAWRMPTAEQQHELYVNCSMQWTTINGVNGRLLTGPNGNTMFLPAAGYYAGISLYDENSDAVYWSRTLGSLGSVDPDDPNAGYDPGDAFSMYFYSTYWFDWNSNRRPLGLTVRPVRASE